MNNRAAPNPVPVHRRYRPLTIAVSRQLLTPGDVLILVLLFTMFWILTPFDWTSSVSGYAISERPTEVASLLETVDAGSPIRRAVLLFVGSCGAVALIRSRLRGLRTGTPLSMFMMLFAVLAVVSPIWSADPAFTIRKVAVLLVLSVTALALARRWSLNRFTTAATVLVSSAVALGLVSELSHGTFRPWESTYRFRGVMHPNDMGTLCAILGVAAVSKSVRGHRNRLAYGALTVVAVLFLLLTKSRGALAGSLVAAVVATAVQLRGRARLVLTSAAGVMGLSVLLLVPDIFVRLAPAAAMGRPDGADLLTLTGRVQLWSSLLGYVQQHPLLGFGYDSFWSSRHILEVVWLVGWMPASSHSDYINALLGLGLIGAGCFGVVLLLAVIRAASLQKDEAGAGALFALLLLSCLMTNMVVEVVMFQLTIPSLLALILLFKLAFGSPRTGRLVAAS